MAKNTNNTLTIFMYPWFAMGHLTPYVLTANKFAEMGHNIIIIVPQNTQSKLSPLNLHPGLIQFKPITLPHVEGLPSHAETTNDVPIHAQHLLHKALELTRPAIETLLCKIKPQFVFFDLLQWIPLLARKLQIRSVHYSLVNPAAMGFLFAKGETVEDLMNGPPGYPPGITLCKYAARQLRFLDSETGSGITVRQRFMIAIGESDAIGFKTCGEIEGSYCGFIENTLKKPILLAGPIVSKPKHLTLDENWANWLGKFAPRTIIYCAFGSEAILELDQFQQLLLGIELTNLPFLIALKQPFGVEAIDEAFPEGFKERTKERGIVHGGWVPQQLILKHPGVGCFVTHCGYGSMWEGLMSECQLVMVPHVGDQYVHARLLGGDLKVGVEVEIGDEDGLFTKEGVCSAIMLAMAEESEVGKEVRVNHDKWRKFLLNEELEHSYFDGFVGKLITIL